MSYDPVVFVREDDPSLREDLAKLLTPLQMEVLAFSDKGRFLEIQKETRPCCVVIDSSRPGRCDPQVALDVPVIVLVAERDVPSTVRAMKAGAVDVLEKRFIAGSLPDCIRQVVADRRHTHDDRSESAARLSRLTPRERQVLQKVVAGDTSKKIAVDLGISIKTVEKHRGQVMRKTQVDNVAELVRMVLRSGGGQRRNGSSS